MSDLEINMVDDDVVGITLDLRFIDRLKMLLGFWMPFTMNCTGKTIWHKKEMGQ